MKKILGLDLGTNSIGWAVVNEAINREESRSSIIDMGVRVNPLSTDERTDFEKGKSITTNADRTLKRSMRRNLHRYKQRRDNLIEVLKENDFIDDTTLLSEGENRIVFETYKNRAKATRERIELDEFARVLLMINKKRGYKSSRKLQGGEEGELFDGMTIAKTLYDEGITPGEYMNEKLKSNPRLRLDFYPSDLNDELERIWETQKAFHSTLLSNELREAIVGKSKSNTSKIFYVFNKINPSEFKASERIVETYKLRAKGLREKLEPEELSLVIADINGSISSSSGYLGEISDRSKMLYFNNQTVGEYLMEGLANDPNYSVRNKVFYRQDYLDEFERIWETQRRFHKELTQELKREIRDIVIFYQRRLKSQKGLINFCEFEGIEKEVIIDGKKKKVVNGPRAIAKSSPLFQEFRIWQRINDLVVKDHSGKEIELSEEDKERIFKELSIKEVMKQRDILKLLFTNYRELELNFDEVVGNRTMAEMIKSITKIIEQSGNGTHRISSKTYEDAMDLMETVLDVLDIDKRIVSFDSSIESNEEFLSQPHYKLWHLLYSYEDDGSKTGDRSLLKALNKHFGFSEEYAMIMSKTSFEQDYGNVSAKAIKKILPYLREGYQYSDACEKVYGTHSKESLTKEEIESRELKDRLEILPKNSLRNPVVEKILNQMINLVNALMEKHGRFDEIRVELARELKNSADERDKQTRGINAARRENDRIREEIKKEFGFAHVSRNDIIRYRLYEELKENGYKGLYSSIDQTKPCENIKKEMIFSKEYDIEHIIPQSLLFDDSFSNKTLEKRDVNIEKSNMTAIEYIAHKYGEEGVERYISQIDALYASKAISATKLRKLKMMPDDIPDGFIERDLRNTQYIVKKARELLMDVSKVVNTTTGQITDRLRRDWELIEVMKDLNWDKYHSLGLTYRTENKDGQPIDRIKDWNKRDDHRHHAMDALTVAFTKPIYIQYLNNLNAISRTPYQLKAIKEREMYNGRFKPPIPLNEFRAEAKKHLESILVSIKAKNKVVTRNINTYKTSDGKKQKVQLTPRGQLHKETIYGSHKYYQTKEEKVGTSFTKEKIETVAKKSHREALLRRLKEFDNNPRKAFGGSNSPAKNPIYIDKERIIELPERVKTVSFETQYTIRKLVDPTIRIDKVIDIGVRRALQARLDEYDGNAKEAFSNLEENPILLKSGKPIKRVTIRGINNALALRSKVDKDGNIILDEDGNRIATDFVETGNNHHLAIYRNKDGKLEDEMITFIEATTRAINDLPIVDKTYNQDKGWKFLFTLKANEHFIFPNPEQSFDPNDIDLLDPKNKAVISPHLFRVQKLSKVKGSGDSYVRDIVFRHHLETTVNSDKRLVDITYKQFKSLPYLEGIVKVRINHIGDIVSVGEY